jgi:predicted transcriptional regulator
MDEAVLRLTAQVVSSYVSNNRLSGEQLRELIQAVYQTLSAVETGPCAGQAGARSGGEEVCLSWPRHVPRLCQGFSMLKRHLNTEHQLTPDEYRARYDLPRGYPLVAPRTTPRRDRRWRKRSDLAAKGEGRLAESGAELSLPGVRGEELLTEPGAASLRATRDRAG